MADGADFLIHSDYDYDKIVFVHQGTITPASSDVAWTGQYVEHGLGVDVFCHVVYSFDGWETYWFGNQVSGSLSQEYGTLWVLSNSTNVFLEYDFVDKTQSVDYILWGVVATSSNLSISQGISSDYPAQITINSQTPPPKLLADVTLSAGGSASVDLPSSFFCEVWIKTGSSSFDRWNDRYILNGLGAFSTSLPVVSITQTSVAMRSDASNVAGAHVRIYEAYD